MTQTSHEVAADQRRYARLDIALSVSYAIVGEVSPEGAPSGGKVSPLAEALSSDISASGLRLMTPKPIAPGSVVDLEISIDGRETKPITAKGEVVWQNQLSRNSYETGTIIKYMEEVDKQRFMGFVFDQMSRFFGSSAETKH